MRFTWLRWMFLAGAVACAPRLYTTGESGSDYVWAPPQNSWKLSPPPATLIGQGWQVGQVAPDVRLIDQHGDEVSLWQFYGDVVLFDVSTMWCAPCQELAAGTEGTVQYYADDPFTYLTILQEDVHSQPPDLESVNLWVDSFGITAPVLADGEKTTAGVVQQNQYPAVLVIGPDMVIRERVNPPNDTNVHRAVDRAFGR